MGGFGGDAGRFGFQLPMDRERQEERYVEASERHREERAEQEARAYHHLPIARPMPVGWSEGADGAWTSAGVDAHRWEVFCAECGDMDGPADRQPPFVQRLRGPYQHEHHARGVAKRHAEQY